MAYYLLTGATGLLGQFVLRDMLRLRMPVAVLVRPGRNLSGSRRIESVLQSWEQRWGRSLPRPVVIEGNLHQAGLGIPRAQRSWLSQHCRGVIHSAASITFYASPGDGEPYRTNVTGTQHLLELCHEAGLGEVHHISTAYVCGRRTERIFERDLDAGQAFGNDYERSKFQAERLVREAGLAAPATIYRPSIVVGDSQTGFTSTYHGVYALLRAFWQMAQQDRRWAEPNVPFNEQLGLQGHERKNLVPVDWVAAAILEIVRHPEHHGQTYHLTHPQPVAVQTIGRALGDATMSCLADNAQKPTRTITTQKEGLRQALAVYQAYFRDDPDFDTTNLDRALSHRPCPPLGYEQLKRLGQFAIETNFGWPRPPLPRITLDVGRSLRKSHTAGSASAVDSTLALEISGPGGGAWSLTFHDGALVSAEPGIGGKLDAAAYAAMDSFSAIVQGQISIAHALRTGRLVLTGERAGLVKAAALLEAVCDYVRQRSPWATHLPCYSHVTS